MKIQLLYFNFVASFTKKAEKMQNIRKSVMALSVGDVVNVLGFDKTFLFSDDFRFFKTSLGGFDACTLNFSDKTKMTIPTNDFVDVVSIELFP